MLSRLHISPIKFTVLLSLVVHTSVLIEIGDNYQRSYGKETLEYKKIKLVSSKNKVIPKALKKKNKKNESRLRKPAIQPKVKPVKTSEEKEAENIPVITENINLTSIMEQKQVYLDTVLNSIEKNKTYPSSARRRNVKGRVVISMQLDADGKLTGLDCVKGHHLLCRAAINATETAQPYAPLPKGMNSLSFEYEMNFHLK